uniref:DNA-binding protein BIN4 n=1 Tax=Aegilops tauschii subsp. strangulata TaxID=200361 RepID=A0A453NB46_AEGTS
MALLFWIQAPSTAPVMLSSDSDRSRGNSPTRTGASEQEEKAPRKKLMLSSDSEASPGNSPSRAGDADEEEDSLANTRKKDDQQSKGKKTKVDVRKVPAKRDGKTNEKAPILQTNLDTLEQPEDEANEEKMQDKLADNSVSQRLPLTIADKVQRSKALVECDGDSIDLSGDIGAVGRIVISNGPTGNHDLLLDLKGTVYKSTIVPSRTFCVVSVGQTEAKIEAIMNDFIQLEPHSNLFESETMMEGTLDGFTFDSDGEGDRLHELNASQNDPNNENEDQPKGKTKRKATVKPAAKGQKKAKVAKKGTRKTQTTKRAKKEDK